jgi:hypothetical protein
MRGSKITAKGRAMERKHNRDMKRGRTTTLGAVMRGGK